MVVDINRDAAARLGLSALAVDTALYDAFGQRIVSTIYTQSSQNRVILQATPQLQANPQGLAQLYIPLPNGTTVPLGTIATITEGMAPLVLSRQSQFPAATIGFDLAPGVSLGHAVSVIEQVEQQIGLPPQISSDFSGAAGAFQSALGNELVLVLSAIVVVYIVLGVLYESFIHPLTILSTLPSGGGRRADRLGAQRLWAGGDRHHRHRAADRHRQEERDHDDRLCPGGDARGRHGRRCRDPPGGAAALPADHDDHLCRAVCGDSADLRQRHGA